MGVISIGFVDKENGPFNLLGIVILKTYQRGA